jgi:hypothetical protein
MGLSIPFSELVFPRVTTLALLGLVNTTAEVETRGELGANLERGVFHHAHKYAHKLKKVKKRRGERPPRRSPIDEPPNPKS